MGHPFGREEPVKKSGTKSRGLLSTPRTTLPLAPPTHQMGPESTPKDQRNRSSNT